VLELTWTLSPPDCVGVDALRKSTWMRPVIAGRELHGGKLFHAGPGVAGGRPGAQLNCGS